jgi:hypothetical protein
MPGFSVPFGGCGGAREADAVDLSEGTAAESATFFLSPAGCGGAGVEGRGECAAPFYRDLVSDWCQQLLQAFHPFLPWKPHSQEPINALAF